MTVAVIVAGLLPIFWGSGTGSEVMSRIAAPMVGGMLSALKFGAPPHGGIAPGVDRIVMLILDEPNLREIVAFPMNQQAEDLLMGAPAEVSPKQLRELHIRTVLPEPEKKQ